MELLGEPGSGTTQLCLQLAVDCTIPKTFGGKNCKSLIVDCNGDTCKIRLKQMAEAALAHLQLIASKYYTVFFFATMHSVGHLFHVKCLETL